VVDQVGHLVAMSEMRREVLGARVIQAADAGQFAQSAEFLGPHGLMLVLPEDVHL